MKKTVSFLVASFLIASAHAGEKIVVASASGSQAKVTVAKVKAPAKKRAETAASVDSSLEAFACCGLPSSYR